MKEERRLVWRVLRHWTEIANGGRFPRRDEIDPWMLGEDGANLVLMAVQSPIELSHFVEVGVNLAVALCPTDTLAGVLLSQLPRVVSARQGVMIEGGATLDSIGILYRSVLLPLSEDSVAIDHLMGAANYRLLREDEEMTRRILSGCIGSKQCGPARSDAFGCRPVPGGDDGGGYARLHKPIIRSGSRATISSTVF